jgi:hypothetical protein
MCYLHRVKPTVVTVPEARCHSINQCEMDPKRYPQPVNHSPILPGECREDEFAITVASGRQLSDFRILQEYQITLEFHPLLYKYNSCRILLSTPPTET